MDGETNGGQQEAQGTQGQQAEGGQQQEAQGQQAVSNRDWEGQIAERDERIAALEAQVAEAARNAETAEQLRREIAELRQASADERVDFSLQLAGCRNVKAARAILSDYGDDVESLKAAEPWLFAKHMADVTGTTGLPNAGAATDEGKAVRHWREVAGLTDAGKREE